MIRERLTDSLLWSRHCRHFSQATSNSSCVAYSERTGFFLLLDRFFGRGAEATACDNRYVTASGATNASSNRLINPGLAPPVGSARSFSSSRSSSTVSLDGTQGTPPLPVDAILSALIHPFLVTNYSSVRCVCRLSFGISLKTNPTTQHQCLVRLRHFQIVLSFIGTYITIAEF
eukprot:m.21074 g.21074  ORF g.21074 m.21074 type:complete len:174 (-) comp8239_c0_seq2:390-911(-)